MMTPSSLITSRFVNLEIGEVEVTARWGSCWSWCVDELAWLIECRVRREVSGSFRGRWDEIMIEEGVSMAPAPNRLLRAARECTPSRRAPGAYMSREELAEAVALWAAEHDGKRRGVAFDANHLGKLERGTVRCPRQLYVNALCAVLGATPAELGFTATATTTRPLHTVPDSGGQGAEVISADPNDRERMTFAIRHPRRVDATTVCALADVLAATRRVEDQIGSAGVLPSIQANRGLARSLLADARSPIRDRLGSLTGELHQYLGWLLAETGYLEQARVELDAALALGLEFDDPNLTSLALSFKGHLAWMVGNPHEVIALSCAARRDDRVFIAQHAFNAHQEARGWAMAGEASEVDRALGQADKLAELAITRQADMPPNLYWYGSGFFTLQRGLTWHTLDDARFAERAATELTNGLDNLPAAERDSEWAAIFIVAAAEALTTAREVERAIVQAHRAVAVCRATGSTRLAHALRRAHTFMQQIWPNHAAIRGLGDEIRPLSDANWRSG
jgi:hypothetical protein